MILKSSAIRDGYLDAEYGINTPFHEEIRFGIPMRSFPLEWYDVPPETESFALVCIDYDNVEDEGVPWIHWLAANIPGNQRSLRENAAAEGSLSQGINSWALPYGPYEDIPAELTVGYGGPAPGRTHEYEITLYALECYIPVEQGFYYSTLRKEIFKHKIEEATIVCKYAGSSDLAER